MALIFPQVPIVFTLWNFEYSPRKRCLSHQVVAHEASACALCRGKSIFPLV